MNCIKTQSYLPLFEGFGNSLDYQEFVELAEEKLKDFALKCLEQGSLSEEDYDGLFFEEKIDNKDFLKPTDKVEISFENSSDTRYSFCYSTLEVIDTSC